MTRSTLEQALGFDIPLIVPIMLILYIAVIMVVGLWAAKKVKNSEDWFVGGRSMGPWIIIMATPFYMTRNISLSTAPWMGIPPLACCS